MINTIILALLIGGVIYTNKQKDTGNNQIEEETPIRLFLFPFHWLIRNMLIKLTHSQLLTSAIFLFAGSWLTLLAMPIYYYINKAAGIIAFLYLGIGAFAALFPVRKSLVSQNQDLGTAHYLSTQELKKGGLIHDTGIVFGKKNRQMIAKPSSFEGNVAIFGGAGTGKTASNLIPTLLTYQGNALVVDIKPELLAKTGHLHTNKKVLSFIEPTFAYDPLTNLETYTDVIDLAKTIIPIPSDMKEPYFKESAQNILASACWEFKEEKSFSEIAEFLTANPAEKIINQLASSEKSETKILINAVAGIKSEQLASLMNELRNTLVIFATDPILKALTSHKEKSIRPQNIEENWIYIVLPESKLQVYKPFLSLIISQFTRYLTQRPENQEPSILMSLDEFPRIGYMPAFADAISTLRSRNVSVMILLQSLAQLDKIYQENGRKVIMDNMHYVVVHNALDNTSQKYFSERIGYKTAVIQNRNREGGATSDPDLFGGGSTSYNAQSVPLVRPESFANLEQPILFAYSLGVAQVERAFWFKDSRMKSLVNQK